MKSIKFNLILLGSMGLLFLGSCNANTENSPTAATSSSTQTPSIATSSTNKTEEKHGESHGGQVVETGDYHLEFVPEKEATATHLDLYVLKGKNHQTVPDAKVTAQIQLPDGKQKTIVFTYDAKDKHYTAKITEKGIGQYQVKVTADVKGEKINGRFTFNQ